MSAYPIGHLSAYGFCLALRDWPQSFADGRITDPDDLWADVAYTGDLCRALDARTGQLIADDFHRGTPWQQWDNWTESAITSASAPGAAGSCSTTPPK